MIVEAVGEDGYAEAAIFDGGLDSGVRAPIPTPGANLPSLQIQNTVMSGLKHYMAGFTSWEVPSTRCS